MLARSIKKIAQHVYYRERNLFIPAPDLLFFDITSSYFTGAGPMTDLARHGLSKDNHPENKMTRKGTPLVHHVFPGNTPDAAPFSEVIEELWKRFGIKRVIVAGDRGMVNTKVIERIEELKLGYIAGVKMRQDWDVKEIVLENKAPFETVTGNLKVKLVEFGGRAVHRLSERGRGQAGQSRPGIRCRGLAGEIGGGTKELIGPSIPSVAGCHGESIPVMETLPTRNGSEPKSITNLFTVDVEDYFHAEAFAKHIDPKDWDNYPQRIEENSHKILFLLDRFGIKCTFFVLGCVAEKYRYLIKHFHNQGHEIACHGYYHRPLWNLNTSEFRLDVKRCKMLLEDIIGVPVIGYRAPTFSITEKTYWALDILAEEGFQYDSSIFPIRHDRYGFPSFHRYSKMVREGLMEIPLSTIRLFGFNMPFAGGGYLRIFPLYYNKICIRMLNIKENIPAVLYIHPWELDEEQPKLKIGFISGLRHYYNIGGMVGKLQILMNEFNWGRMCDHLYILKKNQDVK